MADKAYYIIKGKSGSVVFRRQIGTVTDENITFANKVTANAVESGGSLSDHISSDPTKFDIRGSIVGGANTRDRLEKFITGRELLSYRGIEALDNLVMLNFKRTRSVDNSPDNGRGFDFSASMQQVRFAEAEFVEVNAPKMSSSDKSKTRDKTKQKPSKSGGKRTSGKKPTSQSNKDKYRDYVNSYN